MSVPSEHGLTDNQVWSALQIDKTENNSWVVSQYGYKKPEIREDGSVISHRGVILTNSFTEWDKEQGVHEIHIALDDLVQPGQQIGKDTFLAARVQSYWLPYGADGEPDPGQRRVKDHPEVAEVVADILKNGAQSEQERDMAKLFNKSRHEYDEDLKRFQKDTDLLDVLRKPLNFAKTLYSGKTVALDRTLALTTGEDLLDQTGKNDQLIHWYAEESDAFLSDCASRGYLCSASGKDLASELADDAKERGLAENYPDKNDFIMSRLAVLTCEKLTYLEMGIREKMSEISGKDLEDDDSLTVSMKGEDWQHACNKALACETTAEIAKVVNSVCELGLAKVSGLEKTYENSDNSYDSLTVKPHGRGRK